MKAEYFRDASGRMFKSDFFEFFSKVHPATPFVFYIPIVTALLAYGFWSGTTTLLTAVAVLPLGFLTWCVLEYTIHRYFFHWEGNGPVTRKLHDIVHGYHHRYPDDAQRLVMPLGASIPLAVVIAGLLFLVNRPDLTLPYFAGVVIGYLAYDYIHWATHYRTPKTAWGKALRAHHMAHHFADSTKNYGISHRWLDAIVGSAKKR